jgi:hypothetical protein
VVAIEALVVVKDAFIDNFTDLGAGDATCGATNQATQDGSGQRADGHTGGTTDSSDHAAEACAGEGTGSTLQATSNHTDGAAGTFTNVSGRDARRFAMWALNVHGNYFQGWKK